MSLSGDKGVAQFKKSVKMGHPSVHIYFCFTKKMCHFHREHVLDHQGCAEDHQEARCGWEPLRAPQKSTAGYVYGLLDPICQ